LWPVWEDAQADVGRIVDVVSAIRQARTLHRISPRASLSLLCKEETKDLLSEAGWEQIRHLASVTGPEIVNRPAQAGEAVAVVLGQEMILPLEGLIDVAAERSRLEKERAKHIQETEKINALLANEAFCSKAPDDVLALNKERLAAAREQIDALNTLLAGPYAVASE